MKTKITAKELHICVDVAYINFSMQIFTEVKHSVRFKLPNHLVARAMLIYKIETPGGLLRSFRKSRQRNSMTRYGGCDESASNEQGPSP